MKMQCPYCEYGYQVDPPMSILQVLADPDLPEEDYIIWMERFIRHAALNQYEGIMAHTNVLHHGQPPGFTILFNEQERALIENDRFGTTFAGPPHSGGGDSLWPPVA